MLGGVALIVALLVWLLLARRRSHADKLGSGYEPSVQDVLADGHRNSKGSQMSFAKGVYPELVVSGAGPSEPSAAQRQGTFTDNRLKPDVGVYPNGDRASNVSLQDNEDYSRPVLRVCHSLIIWICLDRVTVRLTTV